MSIPRETIEATFPSGKVVVLREMGATEELISAKEAGDNQSLSLFCQVMRSLVSIDGTAFDPSRYTPESTRAAFTAVEWQLVLDAFAALNRPTLAEVDAFRATFRRSATDASVAEEAAGPSD